MVTANPLRVFKSTAARETSRADDSGRAALNRMTALIAVLLMLHEPALAQSQPELKLCPLTVVHTCYIGYVVSAGKIAVLLSSVDNDPLVGEEVEVNASPLGTSVTRLDLSKQIGSVVMLDATGNDRIYSAKIVSVADPLETALYLSIFLQPPSDSNSPQ